MTLFWVAVGESFDDLFDAPHSFATPTLGGGDVPAKPARQPVDGTNRSGSDSSLLPGSGLRHGRAQ